MVESKTIVVLGNGKSLSQVDLTQIKYPTIGMNMAFKYWYRIDWFPDYYACLDLVVLEEIHQEIYRLLQEKRLQKVLVRKKFLKHHPDCRNHPNCLIYEEIPSLHQRYLTTGSTSLLLANYLGYKRIYIIGIDLNYVEIVPEAKLVQGKLVMQATPKDNPNYFFNDYHSQGNRYNIPNPTKDLHRQSVLQAIKRLACVEVINCSDLSILFGMDLIPYQDYRCLLK